MSIAEWGLGQVMWNHRKVKVGPKSLILNAIICMGEKRWGCSTYEQYMFTRNGSNWLTSLQFSIFLFLPKNSVLNRLAMNWPKILTADKDTTEGR